MRGISIALAVALVLAGCNGGGAPDASATPEAGDAQAPVSANSAELRGKGLVAGAEAFYFDAGQAEVEAALAKALGPKLRSGENGECGAGPITFTDFAGGLTAHFQEGKLVGWNWHGPQDGDRAATGTVTFAGPVQLGAPRAAVEAKPGFAKVEDSTLGEEFMLGEDVGGFIEGDAVSMLYAGTQCFFR